jgi:hypothetical protein
LPGEPNKKEEKGAEPRRRPNYLNMARAWQRCIETPYPREPRPPNPASSQTEAFTLSMMKKFLLRGPILVLLCLAIGFAIVYGGGWLLQQLGCFRP